MPADDASERRRRRRARHSAGHAAPTSGSRPEGERREGSLPSEEGGRQKGRVHSYLVWRNGPRSPPPAVATTPARRTPAEKRSSGAVGGGGKVALKSRELVFEKIIGRRSRLGPGSWSTRGQRPDTAGRNGSGNPTRADGRRLKRAGQTRPPAAPPPIEKAGEMRDVDAKPRPAESVAAGHQSR